MLQPGLIGYDQWQLTNNGALLKPNLPASVAPHAVHAVGVQVNHILLVKPLNFLFKYEKEYSATARPEGRTIDFGGSFIFLFYKPHPEP